MINNPNDYFDDLNDPEFFISTTYDDTMLTMKESLLSAINERKKNVLGITFDLFSKIQNQKLNMRDIEHFEKAARTAMGLGFQGKLCIHPSQIDICNTVFTPTDAQIVEAKKHIEALKIAEAEGSASIQVDGYFIDYPIIEKAERILALAAAISARNA